MAGESALAAGLTAVAVTPRLRRKIEKWIMQSVPGAVRPYELVFSPVRHNVLERAKRVSNYIESEANRGKGFNYLLSENGYVLKGRRKLMEKQTANLIRQIIDGEINKKTVIENQAETPSAEFMTEIYLAAVKNNMGIRFIEEYTQKELKQLDEWGRAADLQVALLKQQKGLMARLPCTRRWARCLGRIINKRNARIIETMATIMKEIKIEQKKKENVRCLVFSGPGHREVYHRALEKFRNADITMANLPEESTITLSLVQKLGRKPTATIDQVYLARAVLESALRGVYNLFVSKGEIDLANHLEKRIASVTMDEFNVLEKLAKDRPYKETNKVLYEYFVGERFKERLRRLK